MQAEEEPEDEGMAAPVGQTKEADANRDLTGSEVKKTEKRKRKNARRNVKNHAAAEVRKQSATEFRSNMSMEENYEGVVEHIGVDRARVHIEKSGLMGYVPITPDTVFVVGQPVIVRMSSSLLQTPDKSWAPVEMELVCGSPVCSVLNGPRFSFPTRPRTASLPAPTR